jgi:glyoxylase-like metal-dependent hydrolase (beta-lactamase superfamily II)/rhodanese-related sulfurtransferase
MLDEGGRFTLVDTRPEESYEAWHVPGAENVPYDSREGVSESTADRVAELADGGPLVAICGKGLSSTPFAFDLEAHGFEEVSVVEGGMEDWSEVYEVVPIETPREDLVVRQLQRRAKGCLGYVVGSRETNEAAVVDATRRTDEFAVAAQAAGLAIEHVPLAGGEVVEVGDVEIEALETPGHTTEMVSYLVDGEYLLTGDTLFVDSVGRTELQFGEADAERRAELLYDSLQTILGLPDDTTVLPGHATVSADGRYETGEPGEPIAARLGDLRGSLALLGLDREAFVERVTSDTPEKPSGYGTVIDVNRGAETVDEDEARELETGPNNCAA